MPEISATDASRSFADLLDAVEHRGETFTIVRRGRVVARLAPTAPLSGVEVKQFLRRHRVDSAWRSEVDSLRAGLVAEERF